MSERPFLGYIHTFRGLAILIIVIRHLIYTINTSHPILHDVLLMISGNSSMFFVFISGFLFKYLLGEFDYGTFIKKRFLYVLIPYFLMSVPALILYSIGSPYGKYYLDTELAGFSDYPLALRLFLLLIYGAQQYHFWFIPMIFLIFLATPLLVMIDRHPKYYWSLPMLGIIAIIIGRSGFAPLRSFLYFLPVFIFGMFSCRYREKVFSWVSLRTYWFWLILSGAVIVSWVFLESGKFELLYIQKILLSVLLIVLLKQLHSKPVVMGLWVISSYSFTIYLIHIYMHMFIGAVFRKTGFEFNSEILKLLIFYLLNISLDVLAIFAAKRILGKYSRMIIGS